jgi:hypothetical protein
MEADRKASADLTHAAGDGSMKTIQSIFFARA